MDYFARKYEIQLAQLEQMEKGVKKAEKKEWMCLKHKSLYLNFIKNSKYAVQSI